jgi:hypothetical protein
MVSRLFLARQTAWWDFRLVVVRPAIADHLKAVAAWHQANDRRPAFQGSLAVPA